MFAYPVRHMQASALKCHGGIDSEHPAGERGKHVAIQPGTNDSALRDIPPFDLKNTHFQFEKRYRGHIQTADRHASSPRSHRGMRLAGLGLAQFRNDIGVEQERHERSAGFASLRTRGATRSMVSAPGEANRSMMLAAGAARAWYCSMLKSTCAGLPLSVMNTGPTLAAFLALLVSWLNSRLDSVVMVMVHLRAGL